MRGVIGSEPCRAILAVTALSLVSHAASAAWPQFGRAISVAPNAQTHEAIASDGRGGAIITWQDFRELPVEIFAQHVDAFGIVDPAWPVDGEALLNDPKALPNAADGRASPLIVPDGAGGAIVAWEDNRSSVTETDIFAQHVLASGLVDDAWPLNGRALCVIEGLQHIGGIVPDGAGGAIVTWTDGRPGVSVTDVFAQHVLGSGVVDARWPANGLAVGAAPGTQEFPAIVEDGSGGAIITWDDQRGDPSGFDIYAQHVLSSGVVDPAWPVNGRALCTAAGDQGHPTITRDGANGAVVAWSDSRIVSTSHIFAEHVLGSGTVDPAWPTNGRAVSNAAVTETRPRITSDGAGGAIVSWQGFTVQLNIFAQHVKATGIVDPVWPAGGRALTNANRQQSNAEIVSDAAGGATVAWQDGEDILAQHVLASGTFDPRFSVTGRAVSNLPSQELGPALVAAGAGGAIVAWIDGRSGVGSDIFALQVLAAGAAIDCPNTPQPLPA